MSELKLSYDAIATIIVALEHEVEKIQNAIADIKKANYPDTTKNEMIAVYKKWLGRTESALNEVKYSK